jgi:hypothetical protein
MATKLGVPGGDDFRADVLDRVRRYLSQERAGRWLLILDNIENAETAWKSSTPLTIGDSTRPTLRLHTYLPSSKLGQTLCVSTDSLCGGHLAEPPLAIPVKPLTESEASILFQSKIPRDLDTSAVTIPLAQTLDCSPLAICQAAAYMVAMRCDASNYLCIYKTEFPIQRQRLEARAERSYTPAIDTKNPCFRTWSVSFRQIQRQNPRAADLLALMSVFHDRCIPRNLLYHAWKHGLVALKAQQNLPDLNILTKLPVSDLIPDNEKTEYIQFSMALAALESLLLVQYDSTNESYSIHTLARLAAITHLQLNDTLQAWRSTAMVVVSSVSQAFRAPNKPHPASHSNLMLHISEVLQHPHAGVDAGLAKARILSDVASWKFSLMQHKASTPLLQEAYNLQKTLLKPQDARILRTLVSLADSISFSETPAAAIPLLTEAIAGCKHTLGPGNRRTIFAQISLCSNYVASGDYQNASTVHYEVQAAASASLQISVDDRRRVNSRLSELRTQISLVQARHDKLSRSKSTPNLIEDIQNKTRVASLRHEGHRDRKRMSSRAFSSQSRVASLDSIVELFEVEAGRS